MISFIENVQNYLQIFFKLLRLDFKIQQIDSFSHSVKFSIALYLRALLKDYAKADGCKDQLCSQEYSCDHTVKKRGHRNTKIIHQR